MSKTEQLCLRSDTTMGVEAGRPYAPGQNTASLSGPRFPVRWKRVRNNAFLVCPLPCVPRRSVQTIAARGMGRESRSASDFSLSRYLYRVPQTTLSADISTMDCHPEHLAIAHDGYARPQKNEDTVTYYRVDFVAAKFISRPAKRLVTEEKAKQHARRVLGLNDDLKLMS